MVFAHNRNVFVNMFTFRTPSFFSLEIRAINDLNLFFVPCWCGRTFINAEIKDRAELLELSQGFVNSNGGQNVVASLHPKIRQANAIHTYV